MFKNHPIALTFVVIVIVVSGLTAYTYQQNQALTSSWGSDSAISVITATATMATFVDSIEAIGTAQANESVNLTSKVTEIISKVNFEDGDFVTAGKILIELTNAEQTAQLDEAQATLNETTRQLKRIEGLIEQNLASELQLDEERARQQTAAARLEAIVARLDDRLVRAPFTGILGFRNVSPGTLLSPGTIVTTLDDISVIKLNFAVPESYMAMIEPGQQITTSSVAYPDMLFSGEVTAVNSRVDPVTRAISVRARLENHERLLHPGMLLMVSLTREQGDTLVVPEEAVIPVQNKEYVFTISESNSVERIQIETGRRKPGAVEVLSGLTPGQEVITQGIIKVRPGVKVVRKSSG